MKDLLEKCCGLDVHKDIIVACILSGPIGRTTVSEIREFSTLASGLAELRDWITATGCSHIAMESTGIYWIALYEVLEAAPEKLTLLVVNARHMKNVPGKKTDMRDAEWIATLLRAGLLNASFIPEKSIRELRHLDEIYDDIRMFTNYDESINTYGFTVPAEWDYLQERPYKGDVIKDKRRIYIHYYYSIEKGADDEQAFDMRITELCSELLEKKIQKLRKKGVNSADVIVMSAEEEQRFVTEAMECRTDGSRKYSAGLCLVLLLYTGMRCGEMIALRWKDVDFQNRTVTIEKSRSVVKNRSGKGDSSYISQEDSTKNEKARIIKLSENALKVLEKIREESPYDKQEDFVAPTKSGRCNTATNLEHRAAAIYRKVGLAELGGSLHVLRRTFATNMYENGARVKEIAAYIGDLESTTERYYIAVRKKTVNAEQVQYVVGFPGEGLKKGCDSA